MRTIDLVGVGFGPSNLAVAVAGAELRPDLVIEFFDQKLEFAWHPDLLFPEAEMQVSFLKDLVSMRNPRSAYSFLEYLRAKGRLHEFINLRTFYPSRTEFNDYYRWVADCFSRHVSWGHRVIGVRRIDSTYLEVRAVNGEGHEESVRTRNLVLADGGKPHIPGSTILGDRLFHASESKRRLEQRFPNRLSPYRFNIIGAGQTAADLFVFLSTQYPEASITVSLRSFAMRPEDDTHFVNELFAPDMPDWFFSTSTHVREQVLRDYASAAHSGASYDLIPRIYRALYEAKVAGGDQYRFNRLVEYLGGESLADRAEAHFRSVETGEEHTEHYDAVILATGYRYPMPSSLLADLTEMFVLDADGRYNLNRDYSIRTVDDEAPRVYLQGYAEASHGFSEVLLSLMPQRAAEIIGSTVSSTVPLSEHGPASVL